MSLAAMIRSLDDGRQRIRYSAPRSRLSALDRAEFLFEQTHAASALPGSKETRAKETPPTNALPEAASAESTGRGSSRLSRYLRQAGIRIPAPLWIACCTTVGAAASAASLAIFSWMFMPVFFAGGCLVPMSWAERRVRARASEFAQEYPAILLAAASSIRSGMTLYAALERSIRLLPATSLARREVETLLAALVRGTPKEVAIEAFGRDVRQPDLVLFRSAFLLVAEHGGRFGPTLERLARICRDRSILLRRAEVVTSTMRMTANVLLFLTPLIVGMVALRTEGYWSVLTGDPLANMLAGAGVTIIGISLVLLRMMSNFKP